MLKKELKLSGDERVGRARPSETMLSMMLQASTVEHLVLVVVLVASLMLRVVSTDVVVEVLVFVLLKSWNLEGCSL